MKEKKRWTYTNFVFTFKGTSFSINLDERTRMIFNPNVDHRLCSVAYTVPWTAGPYAVDRGVFPPEFFFNKNLKAFKRWKKAELERLYGT